MQKQGVKDHINRLILSLKDLLARRESGGHPMEKEERQKVDRVRVEQEVILRHYRNIVDHAHKEVEWVRSAYKWLISLVVVAGTTIFVVGIFFSYKSITDFKNEIRTDVKKIETELEEKIAKLATQVQSRIDEEFKKENIHSLVENTAKRRIEQIADRLITKSIEGKVRPKIKAAEGKLETLDAEFSKAAKNREELQAALDFSSIVLAAHNDDGKAFDQLISYGKDESFSWSGIAARAVMRIRSSYHAQTIHAYPSLPWDKEKIDPSKLSLSQFRDIHSSVAPWFHADLVYHIWNRTDIPKKDKMMFLFDILDKDGSLTARYMAGDFLAKEIGIEWNPFLYKPLFDWWKENKEKIK